jgi:Domain of unknown function (DUF4129)
MKLARSAAALFLFTCCASLAAFGTMSHVYSFDQYVSELDRLSVLADQAGNDASAARRAIDDLRGGWTINVQADNFDLSTSWFVSQFEKLEAGSNADVQNQLLDRIATMKADALGYQQPAQDASTAHKALEQILARKEFHQVHGPTWLDRLQYKIMEWLDALFSKFVRSSSVPIIGKSIIWGLVGLAVLALAWLIYREIERNARVEGLIPDVVPVSAKDWTAWLAEAEAAAASGKWRDAVHLAYWAGISFLEASGIWRPDQARTPREYLRLISAGSQLRPPLSTLTRQLELTWYGYQAAGPESFAETKTQLERLGCRQ